MVRRDGYMGKNQGIITKQSDGIYTMGKAFTLRLEGNKLVGKLHYKNDGGDHDTVLFKRQTRASGIAANGASASLI